MNVVIDSQSGFCFGVVRAIEQAEKALGSGQKVYCLGDIVHNRMEVQRLERLGLHTITHSLIPNIAGGVMLIRAHGEPPTTYSLAEKNSINIIDATCPVVAALQKKVKKAYESMVSCGGQVVILGKRGHAEVVGLTGQIGEKSIVIESEADLDSIDFQRPIYFLSQTTQSVALFNHLCNIMRLRLPREDMLTADDTICRRVCGRENHLKEFALSHDVIIFVCGKKSSNGKVLFNICKQSNPRSYNIEDIDELCQVWFEGAKSVGICGATSTPEWLMKKVAEAIK